MRNTIVEEYKVTNPNGTSKYMTKEDFGIVQVILL